MRPMATGDVRRMQQLASRLWPLGFHPGGLGWSMATAQLPVDTVLFEEGNELAGFASAAQGALYAQADPEKPHIAKQIVDWFCTRDDSGELRVDVVDADVAFRDAVEAARFVRLEGEDRPVFAMRRAVNGPASPAAAYKVRVVSPDEVDFRVEAHRQAWRPGDLPWQAGHHPDYAPDATSGFTAEVYARVRSTYLYDPALDLVAVAEDGSFAGCCIVWFDEATATAEIEPLGVVPEHRRRGVAGALCEEAVRRVAAAGGREVWINQGPNVAYPAPAGAYAKAGFEVVDRGRSYVLRR